MGSMLVVMMEAGVKLVEDAVVSVCFEDALNDMGYLVDPSRVQCWNSFMDGL